MLQQVTFHVREMWTKHKAIERRREKEEAEMQKNEWRINDKWTENGIELKLFYSMVHTHTLTHIHRPDNITQLSNE